ncbi:MAG: hypothetical protein QN163_03470 [Armatimonadota bacterium]|nr:hypothetical protein [Armatimonadota bacterium]MDR5697296.1 hypothetical protein [Armatimonadota bacterium]
MIRVVCPRCAHPILRLAPAEPDEEVVCPRCGEAFEPREEEWVDPEDG